ncbi:uncharacterized protein LOC129774647 [Toxorhynchites rutilus septentrionalis]|uniref:uncharacterized protein LOC129774647 n=1 Tax=Toxorhynchites rutilus septentrionalis TaxID=329112 RepID=UPI002479E34C|nr:uncharacterized protein LOC129774647 [Toxorhynchites rutilus septentrionalis]
MDVYYMSDSMHYGSLRSPLYRDYEKFPYGTLENPLNSPPKSGHQRQQQNHQLKSAYNTAQGKSKNKSSKESCPFCKEQKKRPLGAYMRKRGQRITSESISEDVEECGEEQEEFTEGGANGSVAGSPSNNELASHNYHPHHKHGGRDVVSGGYSRQDSQDSDGK